MPAGACPERSRRAGMTSFPRKRESRIMQRRNYAQASGQLALVLGRAGAGSMSGPVPTGGDGMAQWLPQSWRQALTRLRDGIHRALDRWLPRRRVDQREKEAERWLPVRWSASVEQLGADIHKVLDSWWPRWRGREVDEEMWSPSLVSGGGPMIDLEETDDEVIVLAELPGLDKDDFTVEVSGDRLGLRGEKRQGTG